ncbi:hypothetical protein GCM10011416_20350 [Polaribacter pacificus]|uniref:Uncharacterized protein n=1 Tax=Polaribacter pacificus TaxID=1775173 RepID=A0A917I1J0_9FLAO|nr:hypothetical protein [Polaribacter pacificus]GGH01523.1 hypothetical protein GCM10011416_20350 [Polaribacter pacificus]
MNKEESIDVVQLQLAQKQLIKSVARRRKKIPITVIGIVLCVSALLYLLEEKTYHLFGSSTKMVYVVLISTSIIIIFYLVFSFIKLRRMSSEVKKIGNKLYNIMKLNE